MFGWASIEVGKSDEKWQFYRGLAGGIAFWEENGSKSISKTNEIINFC